MRSTYRLPTITPPASAFNTSRTSRLLIVNIYPHRSSTDPKAARRCRFVRVNPWCLAFSGELPLRLKPQNHLVLGGGEGVEGDEVDHTALEKVLYFLKLLIARMIHSAFIKELWPQGSKNWALFSASSTSMVGGKPVLDKSLRSLRRWRAPRFRRNVKSEAERRGTCHGY